MKLDENYRSPLRKYVSIMVLFLMITAVGIVTVLIPEIQDDPGEESSALTPATEEVPPAD